MVQAPEQRLGKRRGGRRWWYTLFVLEVAVALWPPFYNHLEPTLFGIPFFYWFQLLWVVASALLTAIVYVATDASAPERRVGDVNWISFGICAALFGFITWLGFAAARWRKGDLERLDEWGLGGRRFGTIVTWFLLGGDLYTAYTFIAVPALAFGQGAVAYFAVPYTIVIYPLLFLVFRRLWHVCHKHGYITAGDFVRGRFGNRWLALAVSVTGIVATMPYIALQLVGIQVVIAGLGISGSGFVANCPC